MENGIKRYCGWDYFFLDMAACVFLILGSILINFLQSNELVKAFYIELFFISFSYLLFYHDWWNIETSSTSVKASNKWKVLGKNNYIFDYSELQSVEFVFYNWTGAIRRKRPYINLKTLHESVVITGPDLKETEELQAELQKRGIKIITDLRGSGI